jgi:hypothetical protein
MTALDHNLGKFEALVGTSPSVITEMTHNTTKRGTILVTLSYASPMIKPDEHLKQCPSLYTKKILTKN